MSLLPSGSHPVGRLLRLPLRLVPPLKPMRILLGPLAGRRWLSTAGTHGCWLGTYERELQRLFAALLRPGQVVYDVGANVGFFTLLAAHLVGPQGHVVATEPLPRNLELLDAHLALNALANVTVVRAALADAIGTTRFATGGSPSMGHVSEGGDLEVPVTTIDALVASGQRPPDLIKMDIEGAEARALAGAARTLARYRPIVLLSTHGWQQHQACCSALEALGYGIQLRRDGSSDGQYELLARVT